MWDVFLGDMGILMTITLQGQGKGSTVREYPHKIWPHMGMQNGLEHGGFNQWSFPHMDGLFHGKLLPWIGSLHTVKSHAIDNYHLGTVCKAQLWQY